MHKSGLTELEAVVAVAQRGSFRAAAIELEMSPTALGNAIAGLEARLGVRLFNRTTRSVSLSAAGEAFVSQVSPALADIRHAMESVNAHRDTPRGSLRINSSAGGARPLMPIIIEFLRRYPEMEVDIVTEARLVDIVVDGFDAGVRTLDKVPRDMIAVPFGPKLRSVVVATPDYFSHHEHPRTPDDLATHRCIRTRWPSGGKSPWEFVHRGKPLNVDVPGALTLDEPTLIYAAAIGGEGLAYLPEWFVSDDLAHGRLVQVLEDWTPTYPALRLYYPSRRHAPAGLRMLVELIREMGE
jgi:DNA-binding transcriptional LysR family regulator